MADDTATTGGLEKFELIAGKWTAEGTIVEANLRGLTGSVDSMGDVTLFATSGGTGTSAGGGSLYSFTDTSGYEGSLSGSLTLLASAGTDEAFRGIAFAPTVSGIVPERASLVMAATAAVVGLGCWMRRRRLAA